MKGKLLAKGATAEIFEWDNGQVLKQFFANFSPQAVQEEYTITKMIVASGIDAPKVYESFEHEGRLSIVYERINGKELPEAFLEKLHQIPHLIQEMAKLHHSIHKNENAIELGRLKPRLRYFIEGNQEFSEKQQRWLMERLESLPDGDAICHGDFHLRNVLLTDTGKLVAIDWMNSVKGHPLADVARTYLILSERHAEDQSSFLMWLAVTVLEPMISHFYRQAYLKLSGASWEEVEAWLPVVMAARLSENGAKTEQVWKMLKAYLPE